MESTDESARGVPGEGVNDTSAFLTTDLALQIRTFLADYYGFINLMLFYVLIWPVAKLCYGFDRVFRTRSLDYVIRFCEAF